MSYIRTTATDKIFKLRSRVRGVSGGTSASKTISILLWLINRAGTKNFGDIKENETLSVVSESMPHLKRGAIRDFLSIMNSQHCFDDNRWNKTDFIYTFPSGSMIEFFSADQSGKVRGPRRDVLFINEANNISYETYTQLEIRTKKIIWLDWNPISEYWFYTDVKDNGNVDFLILTYKDNEALDKSIVDSIESRQGNRNWWNVYGLGLIGEVEARIYTGWNIIDDVPHEARLERYGLDFGYTNDPSVLVGKYYMNGGYILDEKLYRTRMDNQQLGSFIQELPYALIKADSSEPKSIEEIGAMGIVIQGVKKGKDSVIHGIQKVQQQKISITKSSINIIKEYRNYLWLSDKNGKIINEPDHEYSHSMDAIRYSFEDNQEYTKEVLEPTWSSNSPSWSSYTLNKYKTNT